MNAKITNYLSESQIISITLKHVNRCSHTSHSFCDSLFLSLEAYLRRNFCATVLPSLPLMSTMYMPLTRAEVLTN